MTVCEWNVQESEIEFNKKKPFRKNIFYEYQERASDRERQIEKKLRIMSIINSVSEKN